MFARPLLASLIALALLPAPAQAQDAADMAELLRQRLAERLKDKPDAKPEAKADTKAATPKAAPKKKPEGAANGTAHWGYTGEGAPERWAELSPEFRTCATGTRQSPIDIREGIRVDLEPIKFDYKPSAFRIVDNGHTVQVAQYGGAISVSGKTYELVQFHFHKPAEEKVNGRSFDMVAHLVHRADDGKLAVVAILMEKGSEHPFVQTLWNNLPLERNLEMSVAQSIDLNGLLPENRNYFTYMGSLTTPPCSEGVLWLVLKQPIQVSADQVAIFSRLYRNNARPIQSASGRLIKESR